VVGARPSGHAVLNFVHDSRRGVAAGADHQSFQRISRRILKARHIGLFDQPTRNHHRVARRADGLLTNAKRRCARFYFSHAARSGVLTAGNLMTSSFRTRSVGDALSGRPLYAAERCLGVTCH